MNFKFCMHNHRIDRNKCPLKISGKVDVGVLRDSQKFSGTSLEQPHFELAVKGVFSLARCYIFWQGVPGLQASNWESTATDS